MEEIRGLKLGFITEVSIRSDEALGVGSTVLIRGIKTKLEVAFEVEVKAGGAGGEALRGLRVGVEVGVRVVYGEGLKEGRMGEWLGGRVGEGKGGWAGAVRELEGRVGGRGRGRGKK